MKNICILVEAYMPSKISAAVMMHSLAKELKNSGNNIWVITFINTDELEGDKDDKVIVENFEGINVIRVVTKNKKKMSLIKRGMTEISLALFLNKYVDKYISGVKFDLIIEYSPNIMLSIYMKQLKKKNHCKSYLVLRDIFPDWARDLGVIKNNFVYKFFKKIEKEMYKNSDVIGVQSPKNKAYLLENNKIRSEKVEVLYNWITNNGSICSERDFKKEFNIQDKIIFLYGGNIGKAQELEFLLKLAEKVEVYTDAVFLIIGDGVEKKTLEEKYGHLNNVIFKEYIDPNDYEILVKQCDVGLVNLNSKFKTNNLPGKLIGYWQNSKPVLAAVNKDNDLFEIINNNNAGICLETGDIDKYIDAFYLIYKDKKMRSEMGVNGKKICDRKFSVNSISRQIMESIK